MHLIGQRDTGYFKKLIVLVGLLLSSNALSFENFSITNPKALENYNNKAFENFDVTEQSPLYREILGFIENEHTQIAEDQLQAVGDGRDLKVWGGLNHVGLNYTKGFGDFSIELKREVAPDLFDDERWIVTDTFDLIIDASQLLGQLKEEGALDISEKQLALFAGISFKRSFTHIHFADSYERALGFNLDKLFFSFKRFRSQDFFDIEKGEFLRKRDSFSLQAGGAGSIPLTSGLAAHAGALLKYQTLAETTLQGIVPEDAAYDGESLRLSTHKTKSLSLGATAGLVADFMGILQMTLLRFDFTYQLEESYKAHLSFSDRDVANIQDMFSVQNELKKLLRHQSPSLSPLAPFLVSEERRKEENKRLRYGVLFYGGHKETKTSHIQIAKEGRVKTFFRHHFEVARFKENIFSRLFHVLVKSLLKVNTIINKSIVEEEKVRMEYSSERNLLKTKEDLAVDLRESSPKEEKFSLNFMRSYTSYKLGRKEKKKILSLLDHFSGADPLLAYNIDKGLVTGPIDFNSMYSLGHDALVHFHNLPLGEVYDIFEESCDAQRKGFFSFLSRLFKICEKRLKRHYDLYQKEWRTADISGSYYKSCQREFKRYKRRKLFVSGRRKRLFMESCLQKKAAKSQAERMSELPLWRLAKLANTIQKEVPSKVHYFQLFGYKNVHVHGEFWAKKRDGQDFFNHFNEGLFKGLGIVDNYRKSQGILAPELSK